MNVGSNSDSTTLLPGVIVTETKETEPKRFNPYAEDLTEEFFNCLRDIADKHMGCPINSTTRTAIEQQLKTLIAHLEMSGLMAPRMNVTTAYDGDHGAGRMVIELLDRELLPIRPREPGYVPQIV